MGKVGFGELAFWLVAMRRPTPSETRVFEAVLVALADHGFTPTAIAARLTYLSAPDSLQGALAAGLLGGGSRFLGVTEDCGTYLHEVVTGVDGALPFDDAAWDALALDALTATRAAGRFVPGLGHPVHKVTDPRTPVLIGIAEEEGLRGPTCGSSRRSAGCTSRCWVGGCRSTGPVSAGPRWPTSGSRSSCCAGSRCWRALPGCSGSSPRSAVVRSAWMPTWPSTATPSTSIPARTEEDGDACGGSARTRAGPRVRGASGPGGRGGDDGRPDDRGDHRAPRPAHRLRNVVLGPAAGSLRAGRPGRGRRGTVRRAPGGHPRLRRDAGRPGP